MPTRSVADYAIGTAGAGAGGRPGTVAAGGPGLWAARLRLAAMRRLAPELLVTAKTHCWTTEELLRTLVGAEITARDASNADNWLKAAAFPVVKTLRWSKVARGIEEAATSKSSGQSRVDRCAREPVPGRAGTGKSHTLIALGVAAVGAGHRVR